jgi:hypothetical protein
MKNILMLLTACILMPAGLCLCFSCGGSKATAPAVSSDIIEKYLDEKAMTPAYGGKVFSAHKIFKTAGDHIYIWAYLQEYYKKDGQTIEGSGWSVPMVLNTSTLAGVTSIISHEVPGDGEQYNSDIQKLFPQDIRQQINDFSGTAELPQLSAKSAERSRSW